MTLASTAEAFVTDDRPRRRVGRMLAGTVALATSCSFSIQAHSAIPSDTVVPLVKSLGSGQHLNAERDSVIAKIRKLGTYPSGWNHPHSVAPSRAAVNDAEQFARNLALASMHLPHISAADDGEINFWWDQDGLYIDLGFFGDGTYSFYARLPNGKEIIEDEAPIAQPLPSALLRCLEKTT